MDFGFSDEQEEFRARVRRFAHAEIRPNVAMWDERCTNHRALGDHYPAHRLVRRCTVGAGVPEPVGAPETGSGNGNGNGNGSRTP